MGNPWFRFYVEVLDDPKVQTLPADLFKTWVNTLCLACKHDGTIPPIESMAFSLRATINESEKAFQDLVKAGLIDEHKNQHGQTFTPHNWAKRQFKSDSSTQRVKRFRNVPRNGNLAPSESDTEQKQIREKDHKKDLKKLEESFDQFWQSYPKKVGKEPGKRAWVKLNPDTSLATKILEGVKVQELSDQWQREGGKYIPNPATWLNQKRWTDEPVKVGKPAFDWRKNV